MGEHRQLPSPIPRRTLRRRRGRSWILVSMVVAALMLTITLVATTSNGVVDEGWNGGGPFLLGGVEASTNVQTNRQLWVWSEASVNAPVTVLRVTPIGALNVVPLLYIETKARGVGVLAYGPRASPERHALVGWTLRPHSQYTMFEGIAVLNNHIRGALTGYRVWYESRGTEYVVNGGSPLAIFP